MEENVLEAMVCITVVWGAVDTLKYVAFCSLKLIKGTQLSALKWLFPLSVN